MSLFSSIPLFYAKVITIFLYLLLVIWILWRPREDVLREAPTKKKWRDLRFWAVLLIGIQIILYITL